MPHRRGKSAGNKRTEVVTIRLDPRLKYLAEIASRKQLRTLSSFVEWAVAQALDSVYLDDPKWDELNRETVPPNSVRAVELETGLWAPDAADRLVKLVFQYPSLLTPSEALVWRTVCETPWFWEIEYAANGQKRWHIEIENIILPRLRDKWDLLQAIAAGESSADELPK